MPANIYRVILAIILVSAVAGVLVLAEEPVEDPQNSPTPTESPRIGLATMSEQEAMRLSPLNLEIRGLLILERNKIAEIESRLSSINDPVEALALHREMSEVKSLTEISILEAQANDANLQGQAELAAEISQAVEVMKSRHEARQLKRDEQ